MQSRPMHPFCSRDLRILARPCASHRRRRSRAPESRPQRMRSDRGESPPSRSPRRRREPPPCTSTQSRERLRNRTPPFFYRNDHSVAVARVSREFGDSFFIAKHGGHRTGNVGEHIEFRVFVSEGRGNRQGRGHLRGQRLGCVHREFRSGLDRDSDVDVPRERAVGNIHDTDDDCSSSTQPVRGRHELRYGTGLTKR